MEHLCKTLDAQTFFVHPNLVHTISGTGIGPNAVQLPTLLTVERAAFASQPDECYLSPTAYICHSSGTSSGLPKPIYQSHKGMVGGLYPFPTRNNSQALSATFTVTPLFHGGTPDCLRAWSSGAMCWLFPQDSVPITGANVVKSVQAARKGGDRVDYFSSVPFVLQMLLDEDHDAGISLLQSFDLVGFGGAALPQAAGDRLVDAGVKLLSRMGSAECGFLMSSHRDYTNDKDWGYLRPIKDPSLLSFEPREEGLSELVVNEKWPFKTKTNYKGGKAYATADLFEPHPHIPYAWRYHGRADAQIVLANGKKFDPAPMELDIMGAASRRGLRDVLIFGTGMSQAGALLFPSRNTCIEDLTGHVWNIIEDMNRRSQSHARIARSMLIVVPADEADEPPLPKSSKGTIMRARAEAIYERYIKVSQSETPKPTHVPDEELYNTVVTCFVEVLGRDVNPERDLYQQGVDSISCAQIRGLIESLGLVEISLSFNVVYDKRTVAGLVEYLIKVRHGGEQNDECGDRHRQLKEMRQLVEKYQTFKFSDVPSQNRQDGKTKSVVVLTGATGFLGAHILHLLRHDASVTKIFCLVRATGSEEANSRVSRALIQYRRPGLDGFNEETNPVRCLACHLSEADLGLEKDDQQAILNEATIFIHAAWAVNFNLGLQSFEDQIVGTRNLINTAAAASAHLSFLSSTAAVGASSSTSIPETLSTEPSDASPLGYSQSKWVTEQVCNAANKTMGAPFVSVIRVGQLCANEKGVWNASEAYPLMLSTAKLTGSLPIIDDKLDWVPVEVAAQAILDIIASSSDTSLNMATAFYHVTNPHDGPTWAMLLRHLTRRRDCDWIEMVAPHDWIEKLETALEQEQYRRHPSQALVSLWKARYCVSNGGSAGDGELENSKSPSFQVARSQAASPTMKSIRQLDLERVDKIWPWVDRTIV